MTKDDDIVPGPYEPDFNPQKEHEFHEQVAPEKVTNALPEGLTVVQDKNQVVLYEKVEKLYDKVKMITGPHCEVGMSLGETIVTHPFENVKYHVRLSVPCELSEIETVMDFVEEWIDDRSTKVRKLIKDQLSG